VSTKFYVPGPCAILIGTGASYAFEQLGWSQSGVDLDLEGKFQDVEADYAGGVAADVLWMGEEGTARFNLSKFTEAIYKKLAARTPSATSITAGAVPGAIPAATQGAGMATLMAGEGAAVPLLLLCPYSSAKSGMSDMIPCYTFSLAFPTNNLGVQLGAKVKYPSVNMRMINQFNSGTGASLLYTYILPGSLPTLT
jgi:hypothetical protein